MKIFALTLASLGLSTAVYGAPITIFNTGVDASGNPLAGGSSDSHWDVVSPAGDAKVISSIPGSWLANTSASTWIWENANGQPVNVIRRFETTFDMTGLDLSTATLNGRWAADNTGLNIFINGIDIVPPNSVAGGFTSWTSFSIPNSDLVQGINTLVFEVQDFGVISGFRAEFLTAEADLLSVPEGGNSLLLMAAGLGFLAVACVARQKFCALS